MADSIDTIEQTIEAQIVADPNIAVLDANPSNIALFKVFRHAIATVYNLFQRQQDDYETRLTALVNNNELGTDSWWNAQMLAYQDGDMLQFINNQFQYQVIDPTKNVIQLCAIASSAGIVVLKCASLVGGVPQQLSNAQVAGAQSYAEQKRVCGITPLVQSYPADLLKVYLNIYYNPQANLGATTALVEAAVNGYLNNLSTVDFNGIFYTNRLIDAIQAVAGIIEDQVVVTEIAAKSTLVAYADIVSRYQTVAGYLAIDPDFPLSATLTYIPAT